MYNILICDDELPIIKAIQLYLAQDNYTFFSADNGKKALDILEEEEIHLILLDIMMPVMDGIETMSRIRETSHIPILLLTAKSEDTDKILGLNLGADDYITKPFNPVELAARVRSQLRRYLEFGGKTIDEHSYQVQGLEINDREKQVTLEGEPIRLTPKEYDILLLLIRHPNQVFSPKEIYRQIWNEAPVTGDKSVAVHIRHIREKIEYDPNHPRYLQVVWGQGYKLVERKLS